MAAEKISVPHFATERDEAECWAQNQDLIASVFERAAEEGKLETFMLSAEALANGLRTARVDWPLSTNYCFQERTLCCRL